MWRMSERSGCGQYLKRIFSYLRLQKKYSYVILFCIDDNVEKMSLTSESVGAEQILSGWSKFGVGGANLEWVEQIWSGWSKFGAGGSDVGRTVWRVDISEKTLLCKFLFSWANFFK